MKNLRMLLLGGTLLLGAAPLAARTVLMSLAAGHNRRTRSAVSPPGEPKLYSGDVSTTSNGGADITVAIAKNFVFDSMAGLRLRTFRVERAANLPGRYP